MTYKQARKPEGADAECDHGLTFDAEAAVGLPPSEVRARWPRFTGKCDRCGFEGVFYANFAHMVAGDW